jgi:hypothetical protein
MSDAKQEGSGRRAEQEAVRTTIVGGRPPGAGKPMGNVPRGIEVLIKKAAVDSIFRQLLLEQRAEAAKTIGLELRSSEIAMLAGIPQAQLEAIISQTRVDSKLRPILMGAAAAVMLVALGADLVGCSKEEPIRPGGSRPDQPPTPATTSAPASTVAPEKPIVCGGSRPDTPIPDLGPAPSTPETTNPSPAVTPTPPDTDSALTPVTPRVIPSVGGVRPDRPQL